MTDTTIGYSRQAARERSGSPTTRAALADALEAERVRLAEAERDPAAEARASIEGLEAQLERQATLDAERAAEQEQLAERWRPLAREMTELVDRMVEVGAEMAELDEADAQLTGLRAAASGGNAAIVRHELRRLQCPGKHLIQEAQLSLLVRRAQALELVGDRGAEPAFRVVQTAPPPPSPHFPAGGEPTGKCLNDAQQWPCATAREAVAARERQLTRHAVR